MDELAIQRILNLCSHLKNSADVIFRNSGTVSLDAWMLYEIDNIFSMFFQVNNSTNFHVIPSHSWQHPFIPQVQILYDILQKIQKLKIVSKFDQSLPVEQKINIEYLNSISSLSLDRIPLDQLKGLQRHRPHLKILSVSGGCASIRQILEECGSDHSGEECWANLETAYFSRNSLKSLDDSLRLLTSIKYLDLSYCQLVDVAGLAFLPTVQELNLSYNQLRSIPSLSDAASTSLLQLNMSNNLIIDLKDIGKFPNLMVLNLEKNLICVIESLNNLGSLPGLTRLNLTQNPIGCDVNYRLKVLNFLHHDTKFSPKLTLDECPVDESERKQIGLNTKEETSHRNEVVEFLSERLYDMIHFANKSLENSFMNLGNSSMSIETASYRASPTPPNSVCSNQATNHQNGSSGSMKSRRRKKSMTRHISMTGNDEENERESYEAECLLFKQNDILKSELLEEEDFYVLPDETDTSEQLIESHNLLEVILNSHSPELEEEQEDSEPPLLHPGPVQRESTRESPLDSSHSSRDSDVVDDLYHIPEPTTNVIELQTELLTELESQPTEPELTETGGDSTSVGVPPKGVSLVSESPFVCLEPWVDALRASSLSNFVDPFSETVKRNQNLGFLCFSNSDFREVDHRLKLFCEVFLFSEAEEILQGLARCTLVINDDEPFLGLFVVSVRKIYLLRINEIDSDAVQDRLEKVFVCAIAEVSNVSCLLFKQGLCVSVGDKEIMAVLMDPQVTTAFNRFLLDCLEKFSYIPPSDNSGVNLQSDRIRDLIQNLPGAPSNTAVQLFQIVILLEDDGKSSEKSLEVSRNGSERLLLDSEKSLQVHEMGSQKSLEDGGKSLEEGGKCSEKFLVITRSHLVLIDASLSWLSGTDRATEASDPSEEAFNVSCFPIDDVTRIEVYSDSHLAVFFYEARARHGTGRWLLHVPSPWVGLNLVETIRPLWQGLLRVEMDLVCHSEKLFIYQELLKINR